MSEQKIRGTDQIMPGTVTHTEVDATVTLADGTHAFTGDQSMGNHKLTSVTDATADQDALNRRTFFSLLAGVSLLTNGDGDNPELIFDSNGDVIVTGI